MIKSKQIHNNIYNKIFLNIKHGNVDVFLCGAASTKGRISYRDSLRKKLESNNNLSILYPEDMFMELLNRKKYDLLTLEKYLANNSDVILIVCESPGSFTELGAFVNNSDTFEKVVVLLQKKFKNAKSFIRQGPVEYVRMNNKDNIIYFNNDIGETAKEIEKYLQKKFWRLSFRKKETRVKDLNLISGQYYFIILLLYFFHDLSVTEIVSILRELFCEKYEKKDFDIIYSSAVKRLFKEGMISKEKNGDEKEAYILTEKGYDFAKQLLSYVSIKNRTKIIDGIRLDIMQEKYY